MLQDRGRGGRHKHTSLLLMLLLLLLLLLLVLPLVSSSLACCLHRRHRRHPLPLLLHLELQQSLQPASSGQLVGRLAPVKGGCHGPGVAVPDDLLVLGKEGERVFIPHHTQPAISGTATSTSTSTATSTVMMVSIAFLRNECVAGAGLLPKSLGME